MSHEEGFSREDQVDRVSDWARAARRVVALTGAGISTASGIPDFRGPDGVWTKDPAAERLSSLDVYMADPEARRRTWQLRLAHPAWAASPNEAHHALADLERKGKLHTLVTQNIDGLHQRAGTSTDVLIEIHGTIHEVTCMACGDRGPMQATLQRVRSGEADPSCASCGGILKSSTISFGQGLVAEDMERAQRAAASCDLFMAIGTSLGVYPVAYLPAIALGAGARLVIFNAQETPFDGAAHAVIREPIELSLPKVAAAV